MHNSSGPNIKLLPCNPRDDGARSISTLTTRIKRFSASHLWSKGADQPVIRMAQILVPPGWLKSCRKGWIKSEKLPHSGVCYVLAGFQPLQGTVQPLQSFPLSANANTQTQSAKMIEITTAMPKHHSVPFANQRAKPYYLG